jgi:hypothetical protein
MPVMRDVDRSQLSWIVQARLAAEKGTNQEFPPEALMNVHSVAGHLARIGYMKDTGPWISNLDSAVEIIGYPWVPDRKNPKVAFVTPILNPEDPRQLAPEFAATPLAWAAALVPSITKLPPNTPVMWTRGLLPDGTWRADSPYGTWGGHVAFADGTAKKFAGKIQGLTKWGTSLPTSNITEALPPGTRIGEYIPPPEISRKAAAANQARRAEKLVLTITRVIGLTIATLATASFVTAWGKRNWRWLLLFAVLGFLMGGLNW